LNRISIEFDTLNFFKLRNIHFSIFLCLWMLFFCDNLTAQFLEVLHADVMYDDDAAKQNTDLYFIYSKSLTRTALNYYPANMAQPNYNFTCIPCVVPINSCDEAIGTLYSDPENEYNNFLFASHIINGKGPIVYVKKD